MVEEGCGMGLRGYVQGDERGNGFGQEYLNGKGGRWDELEL
jgi:hypothetical protein